MNDVVKEMHTNPNKNLIIFPRLYFIAYTINNPISNSISISVILNNHSIRCNNKNKNENLVIFLTKLYDRKMSFYCLFIVLGFRKLGLKHVHKNYYALVKENGIDVSYLLT